MNKVIETIENRYSCRAFTNEMPDDTKLATITHSALKAPSAMNLMPWHIIVLKNTNLIKELEEEALNVLSSMKDTTMYEKIKANGGKLFYNAPCIILIATEKSDSVRSARDAGMVCQNISLSAHALNLGSCICGLVSLAFSESKTEYFYDKLKVPAGYDVEIGVLIGFPKFASVASHAINPDKLTYID